MILDNLPALPGLSDGSAKTLHALATELKDTLAKRQIFRTETEMRVSVLNDKSFPTNAAKYWQCVREQAVMIEQAGLMSIEYRRNENRARRCTALLQSASEFDREDLLIDLDECALVRHNLQRHIDDRVREIALWSQIKAELDDGSFDTDDVNSHQLISYTVEFSVALNTIEPGQMSAEEFRTLTGKLETCLRRVHEIGADADLTGAMQGTVARAMQEIDRINHKPTALQESQP